MGMMTAASDFDYASEALLDLDEPPDDYNEDDEQDEREHIAREEQE